MIFSRLFVVNEIFKEKCRKTKKAAPYYEATMRAHMDVR